MTQGPPPQYGWNPHLRKFGEPDAVHVSACPEMEVAGTEGTELGDAQPCLQRQDEERVVTPAHSARTVWTGEQRVDLSRDEEVHERPLAPLGRDREDAADERGVLGVAERRVGE